MAVLCWLQQRREAAVTAKAVEEDAYRWAVLVFTVMYVDDIGAASINDLSFDHRGALGMLASGQEGAPGQQRRASLHFATAVGVIKHFGHADSEGKSWLPGESMDFLGATLDLEEAVIYLTKLKRTSYALAIVALLGGETASKGELHVDADELNSLCHKLLHAACTVTVVLGRVHTFYILRARHANTRLAGGRKVVGQRAQSELPWWLARLPSRPARVVPARLALGLSSSGRTGPPRLTTPTRRKSFSRQARAATAAGQS